MKDFREMFSVGGLFLLATIIPVGMWHVAESLGAWLKLSIWSAYMLIFTAAITENFLRKRGLAWADVGFGPGLKIKTGALLGLAGAAATVALGWAGAELLGFHESRPSAAAQLVMQLLAAGGWKGRALVSFFMLTVAVCEEVVFRGIIFTYLAKRRSFAFALVCSSFLFCLGHGTPVRMAYTFIYGLVWGSAYRLRGLPASATAHYLHNIAAVYL